MDKFNFEKYITKIIKEKINKEIIELNYRYSLNVRILFYADIHNPWHVADTNIIYPNIIRINTKSNSFVDFNWRKDKIIKTLLHEIKHILDSKSGKLKTTIKDNEVVMLYNNEVIDDKNTDYFELPWEIEARRFAEKEYNEIDNNDNYYHRYDYDLNWRE